MAKTIIGVFDNRIDADTTVDQLKQEGFSPQDMSVVMKDTERENIHENSVVQGAASSVVTGGIVSTIVIPEVGALLIGGPLADAFGITGAAATTVSGQQHEQLPEELSVH